MHFFFKDFLHANNSDLVSYGRNETSHAQNQDHVSIKLENTEHFIIFAVFPALCIPM